LCFFVPPKRGRDKEVFQYLALHQIFEVRGALAAGSRNSLLAAVRAPLALTKLYIILKLEIVAFSDSPEIQ
jgi:hypothetical protein